MYAKSCTEILYTHRKGLKQYTKHLIGVLILERDYRGIFFFLPYILLCLKILQ